MFEKQLAALLKSVLSEFVEDLVLDEKTVWTGRVILNGLVLKKSLLDGIGSPIVFAHGSISRLELTIPWSNLGSEPVVIDISGVNVIMVPKYEWDSVSLDNKEQTIKQAKLRAAEIFAVERGAKRVDPFEGIKSLTSNWMMKSLAKKLADTVQIRISNVHLRFEDELSCTSSFCVGVTLDCLSAMSRELESFVQIPETGNQIQSKEVPFRTEVSIQQLGVYWNPLKATSVNPCKRKLAGRTIAEIDLAMAAGIAQESQKLASLSPQQYILMPTEMTANLDVVVDTLTWGVSIDVSSHISALRGTLEDQQLKEMIALSSNMSNFVQLAAVDRYRPSCSVHENPRLWWQFAINSVMHRLKSSSRITSLTKLNGRIEDKFVYIELWCSQLLKPSATSKDVARLKSTFFIGMGPTEIESLGRDKPLYKMLLASSKRRRALLAQEPKAGAVTPSQSTFFAVVAADPDAVKRKEELASIGSFAQVTAEMLELLDILERRLSFEDIILFRSLAERDLVAAESVANDWVGDIVSWASRGQFTAVGTIKSVGVPAAGAGNRKNFDALKDNPAAMLTAQRTKVKPVNVKISIQVDEIETTLALSVPAPAQSLLTPTSLPFLRLHIHSIQSLTTIEEESSVVVSKSSLFGLDLIELNTASSKERALISRFSCAPGGIGSSVASAELHPLISATVEVKQANSKNPEISLDLTMDKLSVVISPVDEWIDHVTTFAAVAEQGTDPVVAAKDHSVASSPRGKRSSGKKIQDAKQKQIDAKSAFEVQLETLINTRPNLAIRAKCKAPVVTLWDGSYPTCVSDNSSSNSVDRVAFVIDLGFVTANLDKSVRAPFMDLVDAEDASLLSPRTVADDAASTTHSSRPQNEDGDDDDDDRLDNSSYDVYNFGCSKIGVCMVTLNSDFQLTSSRVLLGDFDIAAKLFLPSLSQLSSKAPIRVHTRFDELDLQISEAKVVQITEFVCNLTKKLNFKYGFGGPTPPNGYAANGADDFSLGISGGASGAAVTHDHDDDEDEFYDAEESSVNGEAAASPRSPLEDVQTDDGDEAEVEAHHEGAIGGVAEEENEDEEDANYESSDMSSDYNSLQDDHEEVASFIGDEYPLFRRVKSSNLSGEIQEAIAEKELLRRSLITDIRRAESDQSKNAEYKARLNDELASCLEELRLLKHDFVEGAVAERLRISMSADEGDAAAVAPSDLAAGVSQLHSSLFDEIADDGAQDFDVSQRKIFVGSAAFKSRSQYVPKLKKPKRKLIQLHVQMAGVSLSYSSPAALGRQLPGNSRSVAPMSFAGLVSSPELQSEVRFTLSDSRLFDADSRLFDAEEEEVMKLRLLGLKLKATHRSSKTTASFALQEVSLESLSGGASGTSRATRARALTPRALTSLLSSGASAAVSSGTYADFVRVACEVAYRNESVLSAKSRPSGSALGNGLVIIPKLRVALGFLQVNVDQDALIPLISRVEEVISRSAEQLRISAPEHAKVETKVVMPIQIEPQQHSEKVVSATEPSSSPVGSGGSAAAAAVEDPRASAGRSLTRSRASSSASGSQLSVPAGAPSAAADSKLSKLMRSIPDASVVLKSAGVGVALVDRPVPITTLTVSSLAVSATSRQSCFQIAIKLGDISAYHFYEEAMEGGLELPRGVSEGHFLAGRSPDSLRPFLALKGRLGIGPNGSPSIGVDAHLAAITVVAAPMPILEIAKFFDGPLFQLIESAAQPPREPVVNTSRSHQPSSLADTTASTASASRMPHDGEASLHSPLSEIFGAIYHLPDGGIGFATDGVTIVAPVAGPLFRQDKPHFHARVKKGEAKLHWGQDDALGAIKLSASIASIQLGYDSYDSLSVIDPFDITVDATVTPPEIAVGIVSSGVGAAAAATAEAEAGGARIISALLDCRDSIESPEEPEMQHASSSGRAGNEIIVCVMVSPVITHVRKDLAKAIAHCVASVMNKMQSSLDSTAEERSSGPLSLSGLDGRNSGQSEPRRGSTSPTGPTRQISQPSDAVTHKKIRFPVALGMSLQLAEIAVHLDDPPTAHTCDDTPSSAPAGSVAGLSPDPGAGTSSCGTFRLSLRELQVALATRDATAIVHEPRESDKSAASPPNRVAHLSTSASIKSLDLLYYNPAAAVATQRILCTASEPVSDGEQDQDSSWQVSTSIRIDRIARLDAKSRTEHLLKIRSDISEDFDLMMSSNFSNLQISVLPEAIINLSSYAEDLVSGIISAIDPTVDTVGTGDAFRSYTGSSDTLKTLQQSSKATVDDRKATASPVRDAKLSSISPSSEPMTMMGTAELNESASQDDCTVDTLGTDGSAAGADDAPVSSPTPGRVLHIVLGNKSFALPAPLRTVDLSLVLSSTSVWVPTGPVCPHGAPYLQVSLGLEAATGSAVVDLASAAHHAHETEFWRTRVAVGPLKVALKSFVPFPQVFAALEVAEAEAEAETEANLAADASASGCSPPAQDFVKPLVVMEAMQLNQWLSVDCSSLAQRTRAGNDDLQDSPDLLKIAQRVEVELGKLDVVAYMDIEPFLRTYKHTLEPIICHVKSVQQRFSKSSAVRPPVKMLREASTNRVYSNDSFDTLALELPPREDRRVDYRQPTTPTRASSAGRDIGASRRRPKGSSSSRILPEWSGGLRGADFDFVMDTAPKQVAPRNLMELIPHFATLLQTQVDLKQTGALRVTVVNDLCGVPAPLLILSVAGVSSRGLLSGANTRPSSGSREDRQSMVRLNLESGSQIEYYNPTDMSWENLVDPFRLSVRFDLPRPAAVAPIQVSWRLDDFGFASPAAKVGQDDGEDTAAVYSVAMIGATRRPITPAGLAPTLTISTADRIDVNLRTSLLDAVCSAISAVQAKGTKKATELGGVMIENKSGVRLTYSTRKRSLAEEVWPNQVLPMNLEAARSLTGRRASGVFTGPRGDRFEPKVDKFRHVSLRLDVPAVKLPKPWALLRDVPLEGAGTRIFVFDIGCADIDARSSADPKTYGNGSATSSSSATESKQQSKLADDGPMTLAELTNPTCSNLVIELSTKQGIKNLLVRSTLQLENSTAMLIYVQLVSAKSSGKALWDVIILPHSKAPVPFFFCNVEDGWFVIQLMSSPRDRLDAGLVDAINGGDRDGIAARVPVPEIPSVLLGERGKVASTEQRVVTLRSQSQASARDAVENATPRRVSKKLVSGVANCSYQHWLRCPPTPTAPAAELSVADSAGKKTIHLNVSVVTKGVASLEVTKHDSPSMTRELTILAPFRFVNALACEIELSLSSVDDSTGHSIHLNSGDDVECCWFHASDALKLALRLPVDQESAAVEMGTGFSNVVLLPGGEKSPQKIEVLVAKVPFPNGAMLPVQIEVAYQASVRVVSLYVPYWIVASTAMPLRFQHHPATSVCNANDGLAPDQKEWDWPNGELTGGDSPVSPGSSFSPAAGLGSLAGSTKSLDSFSIPHISSPALPHLPSIDACSFSQCGYSDPAKGKTQLRLLAPDELCSPPFYLEKIDDTTAIDMIVAEDTTRRNKRGAEVISFAVVTQRARHPYQRTKVVAFVDKYLVINQLDMPMELRLSEDDIPLLLSPSQSIPFTRLHDQHTAQVRLHTRTSSWAWSGVFSYQGEGESMLRLLNDVDSAVYFIVASVVFEGPRVVIRLKHHGGYIPFRIENFSSQTVWFRQAEGIESASTSGASVSEGFTAAASGCNSLPTGHACAYSWDDPLGPKRLVLEQQRTSSTPLSRRQRRLLLGIYSFDEKLSNVEAAGIADGSVGAKRGKTPTVAPSPARQDSNTNNRVLVRLVLRGPVRVLQVFDESTAQSSREASSPAAGTWLFSVSSKSGLRKSHGSFEQQQQQQAPAVQPRPATFRLLTNIGGVGVAVVDHIPQELLRITASNLEVELVAFGASEDSITACVGRFQIDNQIEDSRYPCVLYPLGDETALSCVIRRDFLQPTEFFSSLHVTVPPTAVCVDGNTIARLVLMAHHSLDDVQQLVAGQRTGMNRSSRSADSADRAETAAECERVQTAPAPEPVLADAALEFSRSRDSFTGDIESRPDRGQGGGGGGGGGGSGGGGHGGLTKPTPAQAIVRAFLNSSVASIQAGRTAAAASKVYAMKFTLSAISLNINVDATFDDPEIAASEAWMQVNAVARSLLATGLQLIKIDNCDISFTEFVIENVFLDDPVFARRIGDHFARQVVRQLPQVVGSFETLGAPFRVLHTLGEGVWDFVSLPTRGLLAHSPAAFVTGLASGSTSLVRCSLAALLMASSQVASSVESSMEIVGLVDPNEVKPRKAPYAGSGSATSIVTVATNARSLQTRRKALTAQGKLLAASSGHSMFGWNGAVVRYVKAMLGIVARPASRLLIQSSESLSTAAALLHPRTVALVNHETARRLRVPTLYRCSVPLGGAAMEPIGRPVGGPPVAPLGPLGRMGEDAAFVAGSGIIGDDDDDDSAISRSGRSVRRGGGGGGGGGSRVAAQMLSRLSGPARSAYLHEGPVWTRHCSDGPTLVLTETRILLLENTFSFCDVLWQSPLKDIVFVEVDYSLLEMVSGADTSLVEDARPAKQQDSPQRDTPANRRDDGGHSYDHGHTDIDGDGDGGIAQTQQKQQSAARGAAATVQSEEDRSRPAERQTSDRSRLLARIQSLRGSPTFHLYHVTSRPSARADAGVLEGGLRLQQHALRLGCHEHGVELLSHLLPRAPNLLDDNLQRYLRHCGIELSVTTHSGGVATSRAARAAAAAGGASGVVLAARGGITKRGGKKEEPHLFQMEGLKGVAVDIGFRSSTFVPGTANDRDTLDDTSSADVSGNRSKLGGVGVGEDQAEMGRFFVAPSAGLRKIV